METTRLIKKACPAEGCDQTGIAQLRLSSDFDKKPVKAQNKYLKQQGKLLQQILQNHHDKGHPKDGE